jgi:hypothetical protein
MRPRFDSREIHSLRDDSDPPPSLHEGDDALIGQLGSAVKTEYRLTRTLRDEWRTIHEGIVAWQFGI